MAKCYLHATCMLPIIWNSTWIIQVEVIQSCKCRKHFGTDGQNRETTKVVLPLLYKSCNSPVCSSPIVYVSQEAQNLWRFENQINFRRRIRIIRLVNKNENRTPELTLKLSVARICRPLGSNAEFIVNIRQGIRHGSKSGRLKNILGVNIKHLG